MICINAHSAQRRSISISNMLEKEILRIMEDVKLMVKYVDSLKDFYAWSFFMEETHKLWLYKTFKTEFKSFIKHLWPAVFRKATLNYQHILEK